MVPTTNFLSLWVWDYTVSKWYFYAPSLHAATGGLANVKAYADAHNFLHFYDASDNPVKFLGLGAGFWVSRP